jgi:hypothetical protein
MDALVEEVRAQASVMRWITRFSVGAVMCASLAISAWIVDDSAHRTLWATQFRADRLVVHHLSLRADDLAGGIDMGSLSTRRFSVGRLLPPTAPQMAPSFAPHVDIIASRIWLWGSNGRFSVSAERDDFELRAHVGGLEPPLGDFALDLGPEDTGLSLSAQGGPRSGEVAMSTESGRTWLRVFAGSVLLWEAP